MLETPHVVVGATIATKIGNPFLAIPLAFLSHFVLDKVPHWNPHLNTEIKKYGKPTKNSTIIVVGDVVLSLVLGGLIASHAPTQMQSLNVLFGGFAAVLPDVIEGPYFFLGVKNKLVQNWLKFQKSIQVDTTIGPGLATQVITMAACFWWVFVA